MAARGKPNGSYQGMNWIKPAKRLALYLRDGLACAYCGDWIEDGIRLTLDHLTPHSLGGSNEAGNLVTACLKCNSSRGARDWHEFTAAVATYLDGDVSSEQLVAHIENCITRPVPLAEAKELIARRGGFSAALRNT